MAQLITVNLMFKGETAKSGFLIS